MAENPNFVAEQRRRIELAKEFADAIEETVAPLERYTEAVKKLNEARRLGFNPQTYERLLEREREAFNRSFNLPALQQDPVTQYAKLREDINKADISGADRLAHVLQGYERMVQELGLAVEKTSAEVWQQRMSQIDRIEKLGLTNNRNQIDGLRERANADLLRSMPFMQPDFFTDLLATVFQGDRPGGSLAGLASSARGLFQSSDFARTLGGPGGVGQKIVDKLEEIRKGNEALVKALYGLDVAKFK